ncbi:MAG TPA: hypothetical protein VMG12_42500 [Polyangiaceae bacterium]|nr:hypothetical protein [Polyangiaceae bacterium]
MRRQGPGAIEALLASAIGLAACSRPGASPASTAPAGARSTSPLAAKVDFGGWLLAPDGPAGNDVRTAPDGSRLFVSRGTRWVDHPDGSTERSRQVFQEDDVKAIELPEHLGGGYLFYVTSGMGTLLWRADTWTGDLRALGRVDPPVSEIVPGFDRLYLTSATSYALRAIDAFSGKALDTSPLPAAPAYGDMLFVDAWTAVALAGVRGALATFDAGESWHRVETPAPVSELDRLADGSVLLVTERGRFALTREGQLSAVGARAGDASFRGTNPFTSYGPDAFGSDGRSAEAGNTSGAPRAGHRPLRAAVLRGWPDSPGTALAIDESRLVRVRLSDGKLLSAQPFAGASPCRGVALGRGFGFVCGDALGKTEVYAYEHEHLQLELSLDAPHAVRSSGNGGLVIAGGCEAAQRAGAASPKRAPSRTRVDAGVARHCVRQVSGELFDVRVRGEVGSERVAALRDGRVAVLIPPRSSSPGRLSLISPSGTTSVELSLEPDSGPGARLVRSGLWLDELWEPRPGQLGAWVVGAQAFVGVRIDLDGKVEIARVQEGVDETSFYGPDALHLAGAASLRETTDYGFEWRVSALPPAVLAPASGARQRWPIRGCSAVGCAYDDWLRIGFSGERGVPEPARPPTPERVAFEGGRLSFWTLSCNPARSAMESVARTIAPARTIDSGASERPPAIVPESSAWLSFEGEPAPERRAGEVGYDFGGVNESGAYHAYVWGPIGPWARRAVWQARVGDRFSTASPWSTALSRSPWPDAPTAARAFGLDSSTGVDWWFRFGADDRTGVLQLRVRSESSIHLVERDRAIITLDLRQLPDLGVVTGALAVGDRWYVGATRAEQFQLYRVDADKPELVGTYPLLGRAMTQLVGSAQGDELGIWARSAGSGWQVFPIDLDDFEAQPPVNVPLDALGGVPPRCEPGRPGWLAVAGVPLTDVSVSESNTHLDFTGSAEHLRTKRLTARLVIDDGGVCVDSLAALVDGASPGEIRPEHRDERPGALPLTVTDPTDERRWAFRCSP